MNEKFHIHEVDELAGVSWGRGSRLQFIDFRLRWEGKLNRTDLTEHFDVSIPQASLDIAQYTELMPDNLKYDRSSKAYIATDGFRPLFARSSAGRYLAELLAMKMDVLDTRSSFVGLAPETDLAPAPGRTLDERTIEVMVKAIRQRRVVTTTYQSMSSVEPSHRQVSPHALGYDGFRWHLRAFCHKRKKFIDFVLARFLSVQIEGLSEIDPRSDAKWHNVLILVLCPHPELPPPKRRVIELDYGMSDGEVRLPCREAFLYYTLKRLGLQATAPVDPVAQQITLKNRDELQPYITSISALI